MRRYKVAALITAATAFGAARADAGIATLDFNYTGSDQSFTVPTGVSTLHVYLWGAGGGSGSAGTAGNGGSAAFVSGMLQVTPGSNLTVIAGGAADQYNGAYGGGGPAGQGFYAGGGRSAIALAGGDLVDAAGGGSGGGVYYTDLGNTVYTTQGATGGDGGLTNGQNGGVLGGNGADQSHGGSGYRQTSQGQVLYPGTYGFQYLGGTGGKYNDVTGGGREYFAGGGGGGGGYYGGGGGSVTATQDYGAIVDVGGGGGGSSFSDNLTNMKSSSGTSNGPGGVNNAYYQSGVGVGGTNANPGGNGLVVITYTTPGNSGNWSNHLNGNYENAANWDVGFVPAGVDEQITLGQTNTVALQITLTQNETDGTVQFESPYSYSLFDSDGTQSLTMQVSTGSASIVVDQGGSNVIRLPLVLKRNTQISVASGAGMTFNGSSITGTGHLTVTGTGALTVGSVSTLGVGMINDGVLVISPNPLGSNILDKTIPSLEVGPDSSLTVSDPNHYGIGNRAVLDLGSLTFDSATSGTIDLTRNDMIIRNQTVAAIITDLTDGYNAGGWNGPGGILSSTAASDPSHLFALGYVHNNHDGTVLFTASNPFDGIVPNGADTIVKFTYYGDANLDGKVDGSDYSLIDNGYLNHLSTWYNGDFNYDGVVDGSDYTLIDNAFNSQGAVEQATAEIATAIATVPEPAMLSLIGMAGAGLLRRRAVVGGRKGVGSL